MNGETTGLGSGMAFGMGTGWSDVADFACRRGISVDVGPIPRLNEVVESHSLVVESTKYKLDLGEHYGHAIFDHDGGRAAERHDGTTCTPDVDQVAFFSSELHHDCLAESQVLCQGEVVNDFDDLDLSPAEMG